MGTPNNTRQQHLYKKSQSEYEFNSQASEVTVIDGRGRVVWRYNRKNDSAPIRWFGVDLYGMPITVGSYMCRIFYSHTQQEVYYPFVFMC